MRAKKLLFFWVVLFGLGNVRAQYVTIPDSNFARYLDSIIPSAMIGNQMDTTSPVVTTLTALAVENLGIANLTGIKYFTSLTWLDCGNNPSDTNLNTLTSLPVLPGALTFLSCSQEQLTSLPNLPGGLQVLYCEANHLTSLPHLPGTLQDLFCDYNQLTSLPSLSGALIELDCRYNVLISLPPLPTGLESLQCGHNPMINLPSLPVSLGVLECEFDQLTSLPPLPGLIFLYCDNNSISCFPAFPSSLRSCLKMSN